MYEGWGDYSTKDVNAHKQKVCAKCEYFSVHKHTKNTNWTESTCDYIWIEGHMRGCLPTECIEKGIFKKKTTKRGPKPRKFTYK